MTGKKKRLTAPKLSNSSVKSKTGVKTAFFASSVQITGTAISENRHGGFWKMFLLALNGRNKITDIYEKGR